MCSDAPPPPDMTPIANAMTALGNQMTALGNRQMEFSERRFQETMPFYQRMVNANLEGQRMAMQMAREAQDDRQPFRALESQMVTEALNQDRAGYRNLMAGRAASDVEQAASTARATAVRNLSRMGINPNAARFADLNNETARATTAQKAGAMTNARLAADQMLDQKRMNAINVGRNLPQTQLSAIGTGSNVGNSNANLFGAQEGTMVRGYQGAMGGLQGALGAQNAIGNMMNQGYANQVAAYNADNAMWGGLGQLAGSAAMMYFSSEDMKKDKQPMSRGEALGAVRNMPVERWTYKEGVEDEGRHVGPYAEDFARQTGVGNGKAINVQDAIGVALGAIKDLVAKVEALSGGSRKAKKMRSGGLVRGPGTGTSDSVKAVNQDTGDPIRLSNGEYVLPADTVRKVGKEALDSLVQETHTPVRKQAIRRS
jgi:hypothetical protein